MIPPRLEQKRPLSQTASSVNQSRSPETKGLPPADSKPEVCPSRVIPQPTPREIHLHPVGTAFGDRPSKRPFPRERQSTQEHPTLKGVSKGQASVFCRSLFPVPAREPGRRNLGFWGQTWGQTSDCWTSDCCSGRLWILPTTDQGQTTV